MTLRSLAMDIVDRTPTDELAPALRDLADVIDLMTIASAPVEPAPETLRSGDSERIAAQIREEIQWER